MSSFASLTIPQRKRKIRDKSDEMSIVPHLHSDILHTIFLYCDLHDLPSAIVLSKSWYRAYLKHEQSIWFCLLKHHHPVVANLTESFLYSQDQQAANISESSFSPQEDFPIPSTNWKNQFKRRLKFLNSERLSLKSMVPPSPPIFSYVFQVDLIMPNGEVLSIVRDPADETFVFLDTHPEEEICIDISPLHEQIRKSLDCHENDGFGISINVIRKKDARQALLYRGNPHMLYDYQEMGYDLCCPPHSYFPDYRCGLDLVAWERCTGSNPDFDFFRTPQCEFCDCKTKWSCYHQYQIRVSLFGNIEYEETIDEECFLAYLDKGLHYV